MPARVQHLRRRDVVYKRLAPATPQVTTLVAWRAVQSSTAVDSFLGVCRSFSHAKSRR